MSTYEQFSASVVAGNGVTGGGKILNDPTVTLGTPSTLDSGTTNNVTGSAHTHNLDSNSIVQASDVASRYAEQLNSLDDNPITTRVGSIVWMMIAADTGINVTYAGSSLRAFSIENTDSEISPGGNREFVSGADTGLVIDSGNFPGTWQSCGGSGAYGAGTSQGALFIRVA